MKKKKKFQIDENGIVELEYKSRSQKKRESTAMQDKADELLKLSRATLQEMEVHEDIIDAISDYKKMTSHEAKRRQMQYIGRLLREFPISF